MTDEQWNLLVEKLEEKFDIVDQGEQVLPNNGKAMFYVFESPMGTLKVKRTIKPKVLDKKTSYSNRVGSSVKVDYVYSETEFVDKVKVYREIDDDWQEMSADGLLT